MSSIHTFNGLLQGRSNVTRRDILTSTAALGVSVAYHPLQRQRWLRDESKRKHKDQNPHASTTHLAADPAQVQGLARRAVEAAQAAGARYADARLTRMVYHQYTILPPKLSIDTEMVGLGVRALVNGAWGFAATPLWIGDVTAPEVAASVARDAVQLAKATSGGARPVELAPIAMSSGTWATPITIDPFRVSIEEKLMMLADWNNLVGKVGARFYGWPNYLHFVREERTLATTDGALLSQTIYETGAKTNVGIEPFGSLTSMAAALTSDVYLTLRGLEISGKGWELFEEAQVPRQLESIGARFNQRASLERAARPGDIGQYTVVCNGATMASLTERTVGLATQLDRALGYEANAGGTSTLSDPLGLVGTFQVASSPVTITADRSGMGQLATVKWDDEGVIPQPTALVRHGVLTDFQTTREQAVWLAPYYARAGRSVRSNGHAAAQNALSVTMQHMPNLSLEPTPDSHTLLDLIEGVDDGFLIENAEVVHMDFQGRTGLLGYGENPEFSMRKIKHGRLGGKVTGLALMFDATELWKNVTAIGGPATQTTIGTTQYNMLDVATPGPLQKGQPGQCTSHSVQAAAARIEKQSFTDPRRKAS